MLTRTARFCMLKLRCTVFCFINHYALITLVSDKLFCLHLVSKIRVIIRHLLVPWSCTLHFIIQFPGCLDSGLAIWNPLDSQYPVILIMSFLMGLTPLHIYPHMYDMVSFHLDLLWCPLPLLRGTVLSKIQVK